MRSPETRMRVRTSNRALGELLLAAPLCCSLQVVFSHRAACQKACSIMSRDAAVTPYVIAAVLLALLMPAPNSAQSSQYLEWIELTDPIYVPESDDGTTGPITTPVPGFPFWDSVQTQVFIGTNGLISFETAYNSWSNQDLPIGTRYLIAPFWDDVDIRFGNGNISYQIYTSGEEIGMVNNYIRQTQNYTISDGSWMMVVFWNDVHRYFGRSNPEGNTFQVVLFTDGVNSFSIFTYYCGLIEWDNSGTTTIGFSAGGQVYRNEDPTGIDLSCINFNASRWSNVVYSLSMEANITREPAQPVTVDIIDITTPDGTLENCTNCTRMLSLPQAFPFGMYNHTTAYINENGIVSMSYEFPNDNPSAFPTTSTASYWPHSVAPFWSDTDLRREGMIKWKFYSQSDSELSMIDSLVSSNQNTTYNGSWMLIVHWDTVHPFPHGDDPSSIYNQKTNSFQVILTTDGSKSYVIFTYNCSSMNWAVTPTIGYNAGGTKWENHYLTGFNYAYLIGCVHDDTSSDINNIIYDLVPQPDSVLSSQANPPFNPTIGSCAAANYTTCCTSGSCLGEPQFCYCDAGCFELDNCCYDAVEICSRDLLNDDYLIVAEEESLDHIAFNGSVFEQIRTLFNGDAVGIDYHLDNNDMFWSDVSSDVIYRAQLDGTGAVYTIVDSYISAVDDIAVDWIAHNVYWVDAIWARIEAANLDGMYRVELLRTGPNTNPRGIAVDPQRRYMFWTDWGRNASIERADMDGQNRMTIVGNGLLQPFGITVDYEGLKIYWCDSQNQVIEYANLDGTGRMVLAQDVDGLTGLFSLTISGSLLFWTDQDTNSVYVTHKLNGVAPGTDTAIVYSNFQNTVHGIEAVSSSRQTNILNACENSGCPQLCLLSTGPNGYTCRNASEPPSSAPEAGSCAAAEYQECCTHGYCAGSPPTCFCDSDCYDRGDCCADVNVTCFAVPPRTPLDVTVVNVTTTSVTISWRIPTVLYQQEEYYVRYGLNDSMLEQRSSSQMSGDDITNIIYNVTIENLHPDYTYFFVVTAENIIAAKNSELSAFTTLEAAPSGPPLNFSLTVTDNTVLNIYWEPPAEDMQNGDIISYTFNCTSNFGKSFSYAFSTQQNISIGVFWPSEMFTCSVSASTVVGMGPAATATITVPDYSDGQAYFPFIPLDVFNSPERGQLSEVDDGTTGPIALFSSGVPFGSSNQTTAYVGSNGLISFGSSFNSFINQEFSSGNTYYVVTAFWDDIDLRSDSGDIYYQTFTSGVFLDQVNDYIRRVRPTSFEANWMMVAYWVRVNAFPGSSNTAENTFQVILASDGTYTYTIFVYKCGLLEWGSSATVGYSAAGNPFVNNGPASSDIACENLPDSDWTNIVHRLSNENPEIPPPRNVQVMGTTNESTVVMWTVPYVSTPQTYGIVVYNENLLNATTVGQVPGSSNTTLVNQTYDFTITGLSRATTYYVQIFSNFDIYTISSDIIEFTTTESAPYGAPMNFTGMPDGFGIKFSWDPPEGGLLIDSYTLLCTSDDGSDAIQVQLNPVLTFTVPELQPLTTYSCSILAITTGGSGPSSLNITVTTASFSVTDDIYLPFLQLDAVYGVEQFFVDESDDGVTGPIQTDPTIFPFGSTSFSYFYVGTNGLLSFEPSYNSFSNRQFPLTTYYLVAPFWDDVDIRGGNGEISYEIHESGYFLDQVNIFIRRKRPSDFVGTWMAIVYYDAVHPYFGASNSEENTYQVILITDGTYSYTIFTYKCGLLEWDRGATIGYNAAGDPYDNNEPSTSDVACLNTPYSNYSNVVYLLSESSPELGPPLITGLDTTRFSATIQITIPRILSQESYVVEYYTDEESTHEFSDTISSTDNTSVVNATYIIQLDGLSEATIYYFRVIATYDVIYTRSTEESAFRTLENDQAYYLGFLPFDTDSSFTNGTLYPCEDCTTNGITLPENLPFGGYFHQQAFVSWNGLITFGRGFEGETPELFPSDDADVFWRYLLAPFWADFDVTTGGSVSYAVYTSNMSTLLSDVNQLIQIEGSDGDFVGTSMLVATWTNIPSPYSEVNNTFQGIVITNGSRSYAVYTYNCNTTSWLGPATIGYNAPPDFNANHPIVAAELPAEIIACVHENNVWNNLIYALEVDDAILGTTPEPLISIGSCIDAGYDTCCSGSFCAGEPFDCFCDTSCITFSDCCYDFAQICPEGTDPDTYNLLVANGDNIYTVLSTADGYTIVQNASSTMPIGLDVDLGSEKLYWSDVAVDMIYGADLDGSNPVPIVSDDILLVEDLAYDWVSNKLYWVDGVWARIEVMDLNPTPYIRAEVLRTGPNTSPRSIAVEPTTYKYIFWTDYGTTPMIERAFMNGGDRRTIISSDLAQPSGITVDVLSERIYWTDSNLAKIEYAKFDGTERLTLETANSGIFRPFAVSVANDILYWTDSQSGSVYATHKLHGTGGAEGFYSEIIHFPASTPHGIEALVSDRQPSGNDTCALNNCSHICLMTLENEWGYTCACPYGYSLERDGLECKEVQGSGSGSGITPPPEGSCFEAGYNGTCCTSGQCAGYPPTCSCNVFCYDIGDCCSDIDAICERMRPVVPTSVMVIGVDGNSAFITWTIPYIEYTSESYIVLYGENSDTFNSMSPAVPSYSDVSLVNQSYSVRLEGLSALTTYYFIVRSENSELTSETDIMQFMTLEDVPSGPPTNFAISVEVTTLLCSWDSPLEDERNGVIISYTITCTENATIVIDTTLNSAVTNITLDLYKPSTTYMCSIAASTAVGAGPYSAAIPVTTAVSLPPVITHPFIPPGVLYGSSVTYLPPLDEGTSDAIIPPIQVPFGNSDGTSIYVASNGHLTFDEAYTSFFNGPFPGSVGDRYFLAPFWDDVDTTGGGGDISYEVYNSGYYIDQVNRFINTVRPSGFEGTWMLVTTWSEVHGFFIPQDNTFQAIVITDGNYTYSVFVYYCGLLNWGNFPTIGYSAPGRGFDNYDPSSLDIACLNLPYSNFTNVVYRLSIDSAELPLPDQVMVTNLTMTSATVTFTVPSLTGTLTYYVQYGQTIDSLDLTSDSMTVAAQLGTETFSVVLSGLSTGTQYYYRVIVLVGEVYLYSSTESFATIAQPPEGPPLNFQVMVEGVSLTFRWDEPAGDNLILYYLLGCSLNGEDAFSWSLKPISVIKIEELMPLTNYTCSIAGATSGGTGPFSASMSAVTGDRISQDLYLPFLNIGVTYGAESQQLPETDDGAEGPIPILPGFPFGATNQSNFYVGTNGLLSFGLSYNGFSNQPFSESTLTSYYLVAPYWDDVDIRGGNGIISYEIHQSGYYLNLVNNFLQVNRPSTFEGTWMAIVYWDAVHPYFGASNPEENTFQTILITDGDYTYSIFIYKCGLLEWDNGATIGYSAGGNPFDNFNPSTSDIACLNSANSNFTNVIYRLSTANPELALPTDLATSNITLTSAIVTWRIPSFIFQEQYYVEYGTNPDELDIITDPINSTSDTSITNMTYSTALTGLANSTIVAYRVVAVYDIYRRYSDVAYFRTSEPEQVVYLPFIERADSRIDDGMLESCDDCASSEITLENFPFGGYYHHSVYVNSNGLLSFGNPLTNSDPVTFPGDDAEVFWSYLVAPFWSDVDTTTNGSIHWEIYSRSQSASLLDQVSNLIQLEYMDSEFNGTWMMVVTWENVWSPTMTMGTFQAILVTDGFKSYAVFTYRCGYLDWTTPATVGVNAPLNTYYNHPLTGSMISPDQIACVHQSSPWNNVIINIQESSVILPVTLEPFTTIGSCVDAGYDDCCPNGCFTVDCFCDDLCFFFQDCCYDYTYICDDPTSVAYDLTVANGESIVSVHFEGAEAENLRFNTSQTVQGIDFHYNKSMLFFSHSADFSSSIHVLMDMEITGNDTMDDSAVELVLLDKNLFVVVDIAVDWIANNLYWVDSAYGRIEVLSIDSLYRAEILRTGSNTIPTAIAVDPLNSLMFWTDYGSTAMIESAFLDGSERRALHNTDLVQPVGITVDYADSRIYWSDVMLDRIEFSYIDGSGRTVVETEASGLLYPFALTIANDTLFWTDWETNSVYATHKEHGSDENLGGFATIATFTSTPYGIEAILENKQSQGFNPCGLANCSHICLLTGVNENGYTCVCPEGYILEDGMFCRVLNDSEVTPPPPGSCTAAGYSSCCTTGFCAGFPPTCFCNPDCTLTGSCCSDFESLCQEATPVKPVSLMATNVNRTRAEVSWVVPSFAYGIEVYYVEYGRSPDTLSMTSSLVFSGQDASGVNQQYSVRLRELEPFTLYYYRVRASNILPNITYSDVYQFMTINLGPPTNFEITDIATESLTFRWDPPYDSNDLTINTYTVTCTPVFQEAIEATVDASITVVIIDKFLPGTNYTCSVYATNDVGDGSTAEQYATTLEIEGYLPFLILGDERVYLPMEDDVTSQSINIIGGLSTVDSVHTKAFVTTNGFVSLDSGLLFWDASPFPTNEYYINTAFIFAPFWSDIDIGSSGSVSYEVYVKGVSDRGDATLNRLNEYLSSNMTELFNGYWMLVIQWDMVPPFPNSQGANGLSDDYMDFLQKRNTFQAVIISNGTNTYAVYTYNCDLMSWSGYNSYATIGYNLNGTFMNHYLSGMENAHTVACLSSPMTKWHNLVYNTAGMYGNQAARSTCLTSVFKDEDIFGEVEDTFNNLESCPCSLTQAEVDLRFGIYRRTSEVDCYAQVVPYGTAVQSCCYSLSSDTFGALLTGGIYGSSMLQYSPLLYPNESITYDTSLKDMCCSAGLCEAYYVRRPSDDCNFYQPLSFAWAFGDPHFSTLDGTAFTFNGQGEYTLLSVDESGFIFQGRTQPVMGSGEYQATTFTAFAFGVVPLIVEVRVERGRMVVLQNGMDVSATLLAGSTLQYDAVLTLVDENNFVGVFSSGQVTHAVSVKLNQGTGYLSYSLNLENTVPLTTSGLLGTFNGDTTDDFTYPDGTTIPLNSSDQMIQAWGQAWQITQQQSWFSYGMNESVDTYSNPDFVPSFKSDVVAVANDTISNSCGGNEECIFDYLASGSQSVAMATLMLRNLYTTNKNQSTMFPPLIYANTSFIVNIGTPSTFDLSIDVGVLSVLGDMPENSMLVADNSTSGLYHFTWMLSEANADPITFIATGPQGAVSTFSPYILLCACENDGVCTGEGILGSFNNVILLNCNCPEAWTGDFCTVDLNGCSQIHCFEGSQCSDIAAPQAGHMCEPCPPGFLQELEKCADIDECSRQDTNNCQHGCTNTFGSYECTCIPGYQQDPSDRTICIDVDECTELTSNCEQICVNTEGSYTCECRAGFSLNSDRTTCTALTMCPVTNNCSDTCSLVDGIPQCSCPRGYNLINDTTCQDINECDAMLCEQYCNNTMGSFTCSCSDGYTLNTDGRSCDDIDECSSGPICSQDQICMNIPGGYTCNCPEGTVLNEEGMCENIPPVEPTKVVVPPTTSIMIEETATPSVPTKVVVPPTTSIMIEETATPSVPTKVVVPPTTSIMIEETATPSVPTKVVVPPTTSIMVDETATPSVPSVPPVVIVTPTPDMSYFLTVTLPEYTTVTFTADVQLQFKKATAAIISECCKNSTSNECQLVQMKREVVSIDENNVFITNIMNSSDGKSVQFVLYITTASDSSSILKPESIASCLMNGDSQLKAAGFDGVTFDYSTVDTGKQRGSGGLSGGAVAGVVIAVIFVVVAVGVTAAFILFRLKRRGKYTVNEIFTEKMTELSMPEKEDLAALVESEGKL